jgi:hypothetical protein
VLDLEHSVRRFVAATLVAAHLLAGAAAASAATPRPSSPAPSEYVEVVPTGAGGRASESAGQNQEPPGSLLGAVADALGANERHVVGLGAAAAAVTLAFVWAATRRRQAADQVPNG